MQVQSVENLAGKTFRKRVKGEVLRAARDAVGISQEELARKLDVRTATISDRERSEDVSWETWVAWAGILGLPFDWKPDEGAKADSDDATPDDE